MSNTDKRVVLVTGANKGIGFEAVKQLSQRISHGTILLGSRSVANGEQAVKKLQSGGDGHAYDNIEVVQIDITDASSLRAAVDHVKSKFGKLDVLLHNSAISEFNGDNLAPEVLDVNVTGAHDTIEAFLPLVPRGGLIVLVSSEVGAWTMHQIQNGGTKESQELYDRLNDPAQNDWKTVSAYIPDWVEYSKTRKIGANAWPKIEGMWGAYTLSKGLLTAWARHFAQEHSEIKFAIVCPGYCATDLNHNSGHRPASLGGQSVIWPIFNDFKTGHFYQDGKELPFSMQPWQL